jgi:phage shock protein A
MGIITRAYHVGRSYTNSAVAWVASPGRTLQLLVQDMEDVLQKARSSAVKTIVERKHFERRVATLKSETEAWQQRAEVAVLNDRDDLATEALQAKARCAAMLVSAEAQLSSVSAALARHEEDMERLQVRLYEARTRERALRSLRRTAESRLWLRRKSLDHHISAGLAQFERIEDMLSEMEGTIESYDVGRGHELKTTLGQLAIASAVKNELADIRNRLDNKVSLIPGKA